MGMAQSRMFKSGKSQTIRLPKALAFPEHVRTVEIIAQGNARLIVPAGASWEAFFEGPHIDEDFLGVRCQLLP